MEEINILQALSSLVTMVVSFVFALIITQIIYKHLQKTFYKIFKQKKMSKLLEEGWEPVGFNSYGYPVAFKKENTLQFI